MPAKSLYFLSTKAVGGNFLGLQDGGTAPGAATSGTGWTVAKTAVTNFSKLFATVKRAASTFAATAQPTAGLDTTNGDGFRTEKKLYGSFASANWTLAFKLQPTVASNQAGRIKIRLYRSANADGSSATEITAAIQDGTIATWATTVNEQTSTVTFNPGAITLAGEFLFVQVAWGITTNSGSNSGDVLIRTGSTAVITTSTFTTSLGTTTFRDILLGLDPLAYWRLGDTAVTTMLDSIGGRNGSYGTGTAVNQSSILPSDAAAKSVQFDANLAHFAQVAHDAGLALVYPFTIVALVKPDRANGASGTYDRILAKPNTMGSNSAPWNDYGLGAYGGFSRFFFTYSLSGTENVLNADADIVSGTVYLLVVVCTSGAQTFYIDAVAQSSAGTSTTNPGASGQPLQIGRRNDTDNPGSGFVQEVALFNIALTLTDIQALQAARSSGTTYTVSVGGALTSSGVDTEQPQKMLAGVLTDSGAVAVQRARVAALAGALAPTGVDTEQPQHRFAGALTSAGALVASRIRSVAISGALTSSGLAANRLTRAVSLAGSLTSAGALAKQVSRAFSGALTSSGVVSKLFTRVVAVAGNLTPTGALRRASALVRGGALTSSGSLATLKTRLISISGALTPTGALSKTISRLVAGTLTSSGILLKQVARRVTGALTSAGSVSAPGQPHVNLAGTLTSAGQISKSIVRSFGGTLTPTGSLLRVVSKRLLGTLSSAGSVVAQKVTQTIEVSVSGVLTTGGQIRQALQRSLSGNLPASGNLGRQIQTTVAGLLGSSGANAVSVMAQRFLAGTLTSAGSVLAQGLGILRSVKVFVAQPRSFNLRVRARRFAHTAATRVTSFRGKSR